MTYYYEGTNNVVAGTAVAMSANGDSLYVAGGVHVGSSAGAIGVLVTGNNTRSTIYGEVLSLGSVGFQANTSSNYLTIAKSGSISGYNTAVKMTAFETVENAGTISGYDGIAFNGSGSNTLINSGDILAQAGLAVFMQGGANHLANSGQIVSAYTAIQMYDFNLGEAGSDIYNSGLIASVSTQAKVIQGSTAPLVVNNDGTILGYIAFGPGADTYDGQFGKITGLVDGFTGDDTIVCGHERNALQGGAGTDWLEGGAGRDHYLFAAATESTGAGYDTISGFEADRDKLDLDFAVTGINAKVGTGRLREAHFDSDLATAVGAAQLDVNHAVLFTPSKGDLKGHTFLVIDANGAVGYQAGADYVIELRDSVNLGHFSVHDFGLST